MSKLIQAGLFILLSVLIISIWSCSPQACFDETEAKVKASFYSALDSTKAITPDSITLFGVGRDTSKIYDKSPKIQPALIPLNTLTDTCALVLRINGIGDTITFIYTSFPHLLSKECGYTYYHTLDTAIYTKHIISKIKISDKNITTLNVKNLEIYY
jgi:hypothetical protein